MCKVLIIDDEDAICQMLIYALTRDGIDAEIATDGCTGLDKFDRERFDAVITDIRMPGIDGNGIARHIRSSAHPATPIIGISGTSWLMEQHQFDAVFEKPFPLHQLVNAVRHLTRCALPAAAAQS